MPILIKQLTELSEGIPVLAASYETCWISCIIIQTAGLTACTTESTGSSIRRKNSLQAG
ncbi:hypothetical protein PO124_20710 [Bacillus licheniformis]|nr:hypothetical protein [Bacillus licheniformis]